MIDDDEEFDLVKHLRSHKWFFIYISTVLTILTIVVIYQAVT